MTLHESCLLGASKDHINRRKQNKFADVYSKLRERTKQVTDKNFIIRNITIFNFHNSLTDLMARLRMTEAVPVASLCDLMV
jgi:hypothetical protein